MTRGLAAGRLMAPLSALTLAASAWIFSAPPDSAAALAPVQTAWWNIANQGSTPLPPPPDVDTSKHDLYVQGAAGPGLPVQPPTGNAQAGAQALAAIRYTIPEGAAVQKLTLTLTGNKSPAAPSVVACSITDTTFKSEDNGPASDIPKYDCSAPASGKVNAAGAVEFTDIGKLVRGPDLLLMLVPGPLDRVVFAQPDASALQVTGGVTAQLPPNSAPASVPGSAGSTASNDGGSTATAPIGGLPLPAPLPTNAPAGGPGQRAQQAAHPAAIGPRLPLSEQQTRLVVGATALAAIAAFAVMVLLGPRMNAPSSASLVADGGSLRGVGRFAKPRTGRIPRIW